MVVITRRKPQGSRTPTALVGSPARVRTHAPACTAVHSSCCPAIRGPGRCKLQGLARTRNVQLSGVSHLIPPSQRAATRGRHRPFYSTRSRGPLTRFLPQGPTGLASGPFRPAPPLHWHYSSLWTPRSPDVPNTPNTEILQAAPPLQVCSFTNQSLIAMPPCRSESRKLPSQGLVAHPGPPATGTRGLEALPNKSNGFINQYLIAGCPSTAASHSSCLHQGPLPSCDTNMWVGSLRGLTVPHACNGLDIGGSR